MNPVKSVYHRLVPYPLRISLWEWRQRGLANIDPDRIPSPDASAAESYAVRLLGKRAIAQSAFARAVIAGNASKESEHAMLKTWIEFVLGTNARGDDVVRAVSTYMDLKGKRHLDIGCAYGGTPIAFAHAGAEAYGVEIDGALLTLAAINQSDHPEAPCTLLTGDILQPELAQRMGTFDIITCDNVIEHVEKATGLVSAINEMLRPGGVCHMGIPNAFSYTEVAHDGHYGLFGLTLLERKRAIAYFRAAGHAETYGVGEYCFTYNDYVAMFREYGLSDVLLNALAYDKGAVEHLREQIQGLPALFQKQVADAKIPAELQGELREALDLYLAQFQRRYAAYRAATNLVQVEALGSRLLNDYQVERWDVLIRPLTRKTPDETRPIR